MQIALYLGAFFVIVAAFILAALVEIARLPILGITTILFYGSALFTFRRLNLASFILFAVGTFMLPINAGVIRQMLGPLTAPAEPYWLLVAIIVGVIWLVGTLLYRSRLFSLLTLAAFDSAAIFFGLWLEVEFQIHLLLLAVLALTSVPLADAWRRRQGEKLFWPLFITAQLQMAALLAISLPAIFGQALFEEQMALWLWLVVGSLWLLGSLFYMICDRLPQIEERRQSLWSYLFPVPAAICLTAAPLLALGAFEPTVQLIAWGMWLWALLLALVAAVVHWLPGARWQPYALSIFMITPFLFLPAAAAELTESEIGSTLMLAATAGLYAGLTVQQRRWYFWGGALLTAYLAYLSIFEWPAVEKFQLFPGYIHLLPTIAYLSLEWGLGRLPTGGPKWTRSPFILGIGIGLLDFFIILVAGLDSPLSAGIAYAALAIFLLFYSALHNRPLGAVTATTCLAMALGFGLFHLESQVFTLPLVLLAAGYYGAGLVLKPLKQLHSWSLPFVISGLALGAVMALAAPVSNETTVVAEATGVIGVAIVAGLYTLEAFRQNNIWLGFPANFFYFIAYALALVHFEVDQPQFYSLGAGLLGIIMHYLLLRRDHQLPALGTGVISQLILLSTTYIQMMSGGQLRFFFLLFFQSLALLTYGLIVRAGSFVVVPIIFVVLGVIGVAFSVLSGLPTAVLIGCTGMLLLLLGTVAMLMREQLLGATQSLGGRMGRWQL